MKKQLVRLLAIIALAQGATLFAREMRAPIPFRNGFQRFEHYAYICENVDKCWDFDVWAGAWHRQAPDAFRSGTNKEGLAALYFGADRFTLSQIVPAGSVVPDFFNVPLTPRFSYAENGAMFGLNINHRFDCGKWDVGTRINVPFRSVTVTLDNAPLVDTSAIVTDNTCLINNPAPERIETGAVPATLDVPESFAYRLNCLTALNQVVNGAIAPTDNLVTFNYPVTNPADGSVTNHIAINDKVVDNYNNYPVYVVSVPAGQQPALPFSRTQAQVNALPDLQADGTIPGGGNAARFSSTIDYTALANNAAAQSTLWVVPTEVGDGITVNPNISLIADDIRGFVTPFITEQLAVTVSPIDFLRERGITFDTQNRTGAGDLDVDFYARRNFCGCHSDWYVEGITGIRFPTAKRIENPGFLLAQPDGNNHHFELKLGAQIGAQPCEWFAIKADAQFYHVFKHREAVAAPFVGSTIKNIGPTIDSTVSWNYFLGNIDLTFVVPCAKNCSGIDIGYQPYFKLQDKVTFDQVAALDILGNLAALNPALIESNTKRSAQRIKIELFHKTCSWEIYGGWLHSVAGKNIQHESDWYLGFGMFF